MTNLLAKYHIIIVRNITLLGRPGSIVGQRIPLNRHRYAV